MKNFEIQLSLSNIFLNYKFVIRILSMYFHFTHKDHWTSFLVLNFSKFRKQSAKFHDSPCKSVANFLNSVAFYLLTKLKRF